MPCYSGLSVTAERGVTPVYLRCREGSVSWLYPRGALRLLFRPPLPADERDFRVCIRVIRRPDPPDLFHSLQLNDSGKLTITNTIIAMSFVLTTTSFRYPLAQV